MKNKNNIRLTFSIIFPIGLLIIFFLFSQRHSIQNHTTDHIIVNKEKQKGAHIFGIVDSTNFQSFHQNNIEWITMVSWGFQKDINSPKVSHHDGDSINIKRHDDHWIRRIEQVRDAGFKVFFKPHLWIDTPTDGKWRSDIFPDNKKDWETWKKTYRDFILRYAKVAEKANAEMFCMGIEFSRLTVEKPNFWKELIQDIRKVYSGKLTYSANWYNEYEKISFWDELDFIGIQAYFPLTNIKSPSVNQISKGWKKHLSAIESIYKKFNKRIIFTEIGYRSTTNSAIKPWEWVEGSSNSEKDYSPETQANCYTAFFSTVWKKDWLAGAHIWQLRSDYKVDPEKKNIDFTPQGKPAESIITKGYK